MAPVERKDSSGGAEQLSFEQDWPAVELSCHHKHPLTDNPDLLQPSATGRGARAPQPASLGGTMLSQLCLSSATSSLSFTSCGPLRPGQKEEAVKHNDHTNGS